MSKILKEPKGTQRDTTQKKEKTKKKSYLKNRWTNFDVHYVKIHNFHNHKKHLWKSAFKEPLFTHIFRKQKKLTYQGFVEMQALKIFFD